VPTWPSPAVTAEKPTFTAVENVTITTGGTSSGSGVCCRFPSTSVPFGNVTDGSTSTSSFIVSNTGATALNVTAVTPPAAPFAAPSPLTVNTVINPGQSLTESVTFDPTARADGVGIVFDHRERRGGRACRLAERHRS